MGTIFGVVLVFGFLAFITYELYGIVRFFIEKKKSKIRDKEDDVE